MHKYDLSLSTCFSPGSTLVLSSFPRFPIDVSGIYMYVRFRKINENTFLRLDCQVFIIPFKFSMLISMKSTYLEVGCSLI